MLDESDGEPARHGVEGRAATDDAPADHEDIDSLGAQGALRCPALVGTEDVGAHEITLPAVGC